MQVDRHYEMREGGLPEDGDAIMLPTMRLFTRGILLACAFLASPAASQMQSCVEPPLGLLGWWPGDGDSIDVQSSLHGVALNGASYGPGVVGEAFYFNGLDDGQDDRVDLPPSALDGLADVTIEMWVWAEGELGAFLSGARTDDPGTLTDNELNLVHGVRGLVSVVQQTSPGFLPIFVDDGAWHHLAFTRSGALGTLYVDGVAVDSRSVPTGLFEIGPGGLMLGQEQDCLGGCFNPMEALNGGVDEFSIYDRALSDEEILAIFDANEAGKCKRPSNADLLQDIAQLESEVESLLDVITDLEAAAEETDRHPCHHSHWKRGCWKSRIHDYVEELDWDHRR